MALVQQIWHGRSEELCLRLRAKSRVRTIITDPPFGVDNQSNQAVTEHGKQYARKIANDETPEVAIATFKAVMGELLPATLPDSDCYVFTSYQVLSDWLVMTDQFMPLFGFKRKAICVWEKDGPGMGDTECPWGMGSEFILYFQKGRPEKQAHWSRRNSVIRGPQLRPNELIHPHEKPEWLYELLINASTKKGDFIVDPFGGSGVLARAAKKLERSAVAIEYDEHNFNLATQKFETQGDAMF
jgi:adenine-specific DNA-methyltransferase